jgi:hypothetical protein
MSFYFRNQSGFSMIQGMVLGAIVAGSSLVATRMLTDQKLALKGAQSRDQLNQLHEVIFSTLQNPDNCKATVLGDATPLITTDNISNALVKLPQQNPLMSHVAAVTHLKVNDASITNTTFNGADILFESGKTYMNNSIRIVQMKWEYPVPLANVIKTSTNLNPTAMSDGLAYLHITYERLKDDDVKRLKNGYGAKDLKKTIVVRIKRVPIGSPMQASNVFTNDFESCYAVSNEAITNSAFKDPTKELCENMNSDPSNTLITDSLFIWDENISTCLPKSRECAPDEIFTGINSNGVTKCRIPYDWIDMNNYIDSSGPSSCLPNYKVKFEVVPGNKVKIKCTPP